MKKLLIILLLFVSAHVYAEYKNALVLKAGITPYSVLTSKTEFNLTGVSDITETQNADFGVTAYAEYYREINNLVSVGAGISQQFDRAAGNNDGSFYFTSLYLAPKLNFYDSFYFFGHVGISLITSNQLFGGIFKFDRNKPGFYYALGAGYEYKNFIFEFLYSIYNVTREFDLAMADSAGNHYTEEIKNRANYQTFNFNIGYKFDF
ncbi:MAG: hypothetical protein FWC57_03830 [Endomicrobia bacterium]|nr:hypothetical protein [Endomicrobiia bacterium]